MIIRQRLILERDLKGHSNKNKKYRGPGRSKEKKWGVDVRIILCGIAICTSWVSCNRNQSVVRTLSERASRRRINIHNHDDSRMEAERTLDPKNKTIISCFFQFCILYVCSMILRGVFWCFQVGLFDCERVMTTRYGKRSAVLTEENEEAVREEGWTGGVISSKNITPPRYVTMQYYSAFISCVYLPLLCLFFSGVFLCNASKEVVVVGNVHLNE